MSFKDVLTLIMAVILGLSFCFVLEVLHERDLSRVHDNTSMELPKEQDVLMLSYAIDKGDSYIYAVAIDILRSWQSNTPEQISLRLCLVNTLGGWYDAWVDPSTPEEEVVEVIQSCSAGLNYYP